MPKSAKRRKTTKSGGARQQQVRVTSTAATTTTVAANDAPTTTVAARRRVAPKPHPLQDLIFPVMVALGCWGMAFTLAVFYTDPNRYLFAGMAALMAALWTYSAVIRIRKALLARQQGM